MMNARALPTYGGFTAWFAIVALDIQFFLQGVDSGIVTFLVKPIEAALHVNDVGFATITATAFLLGVTVAFYPAGLLGDVYRRRNIVAIGCAVWALAAVATVFAQTPVLFFCARFIAGLGSGITVGPAFSILCDALPSSRRAAVFGVFNAGLAIGQGVGLTTCGALVALAERNGQLHLFGRVTAPWEQCFLAVAMMGTLTTLLALAITEPPRRELAARDSSNAGATFKRFVAYVRKHARLWLCVFVASTISSMAFFAANYAWGPALAARRYGVHDVGSIAWLGNFEIVGALTGSVVAGLFAQYSVNSSRPWLVPYGMATVTAIGGCAAIALPFMPTWLFAAAGLAAIVGCSQAINLLFSLIIQEGAPNQTRGQLCGLNAIIGAIPSLSSAPLVAFFAEHWFATSGGLGPALALVGGTSSLFATVLYASVRAPYIRAVNEVSLDASQRAAAGAAPLLSAIA
jgi:predicted MFS family arabinose efflux permease